MLSWRVRNYSRYMKVHFRPGKQRLQAFLRQAATPMLFKEYISDFNFTAFDQAETRAANEFGCFEFDYHEVGKAVGFETSSVHYDALQDLRRCHYAIGEMGTHFGVRIQFLKIREVGVFG